MSWRRLAGPLGAALAVGGYALAWRRYGVFDLGEQGLLLAQGWRVAHGEQPYVDFHTGYGPLYFQLLGALVRAGGLPAVRLGLAAVQGIVGGTLYALARRQAGSVLAAVAVALYVSFCLPVAPADGAPFNVPYPAWFAAAGGLIIATTVDSAAPARGRALMAGVLAALVAGIKQSSGILFVAGAAVALVLGEQPRVGSRRLASAVLALAVVTGVAVVAPSGLTTTTWVVLPPLVAFAAAGVPWRRADADVAAILVWLGVGFLGTAGLVFAGSLSHLGTVRFGRDVLLLGAGVAEVYALPARWSTVLAASVGAMVLLGRTSHQRRRWLVWSGAGSVALAAVVGGSGAGRLATALRLGGEEAAFAALALVAWGAVALLRRGLHRGATGSITLGVLGLLQLYPRVDFEHAMPLVPLLLPVGMRLWRSVPLAPRTRAGLVVALPVILALGRFAPTAQVLLARLRGQAVAVADGTTVLEVLPAGASQLEALAVVVREITARTRPEEAVLTFPACALTAFLADRRPAGPHDYFYPGRPSSNEVTALVERLERTPPRVAVGCTAHGTDLAAAWEYFPAMRAFLTQRYRVVLERDPFTLYEARP